MTNYFTKRNKGCAARLSDLPYFRKPIIASNNSVKTVYAKLIQIKAFKTATSCLKIWVQKKQNIYKLTKEDFSNVWRGVLKFSLMGASRTKKMLGQTPIHLLRYLNR